MMKNISLVLLALGTLLITAQGNENVLTTVYQPLDPMVGGSVVVREVPFVTGGAFPEVLFTAITYPHIPQQLSSRQEGDINVASRAGVFLRCESAAAGQKKLYIIWDFSQADEQLVTKDLIHAMLICLERTSGGSITLYSKFIAGDKFPNFRKMIEAKFPPQTDEQFEAGSHGQSKK
ncbi:hypothetical protein JIN85_20215 [Luteolibacter pohnpeiensis]|uniref:DUF695 domain-containing protein n=1 Tax=Luteolibacter pohnpeiensis TaxID=454153 RepID=A0A934SGH6_9BACT|nr:hypothetical protein [Luteolibacter pohnpeiensis]MBK1884748.1 hypothetical protein [Luteolibacter pohnpeiensis]